jgi:hypothetical protein
MDQLLDHDIACTSRETSSKPQYSGVVEVSSSVGIVDPTRVEGLPSLLGIDTVDED